jgi:MFS family permease
MGSVFFRFRMRMADDHEACCPGAPDDGDHGVWIAAAMLLIFTRLQGPTWMISAPTASSFAAEFCGPVTWTTCMDLGGGCVGSFAGAMNTLGLFGGAVAPAAIGYILKWTNYNWATAFYVSAAIYGCGILCWSFLDPVTPLGSERAKR